MDFLVPLGHVMDQNVLREFGLEFKELIVRLPNTIILLNRKLSMLGSGPRIEKFCGLACTARACMTMIICENPWF